MGIMNSMMERQQDMMKANMNRQLRIMTATQMSYTRELIPWLVIPYSILSMGVLGRLVSKKQVPGVLYAPVVMGLLIAYQIDFAYGRKTDRATNYFKTIFR
jgi:hypothetical protein